MSEQEPTVFATPLAMASRVLVVDRLGAHALEGLRTAGCDAIQNPLLEGATLPDATRDIEPDVLVVRDAMVDDRVLGATERLGLVIGTGPTIESIDVEAASNRGICVAHCPGRTSSAVAELAWALILACDRDLVNAAQRARGGQRVEGGREAPGVSGRTLGVVGLGQVGQEVARRGIAFGMHVVAWSQHITETRCNALGIDYCANLVNLAKLSDVVSVSVTGNEQSEGLLGEKFFQALRAGSTIVNTSLGSVVNDRALLHACRTKGIRAGLDLHSADGLTSRGSVLADLIAETGVITTLDAGAHTAQARESIDLEVVRILRQWLEHGTVAACVNRSSISTATTLVHVRHLNRPGVLVGIFDVVGQAGINVEEMENVICEGGHAAIARIHLNELPTERTIQQIRQAPHVLGVHVQSIRRGASS
jgi:D-3-phosphoglycerate dehydrogenase